MPLPNSFYLNPQNDGSWARISRKTLLTQNLGNGVTIWIESVHRDGKILWVESRCYREGIADDEFNIDPEPICEFPPEECCPNCGWADPLLGAENGNCRNPACNVYLEWEDGALTDQPKGEPK